MASGVEGAGQFGDDALRFDRRVVRFRECLKFRELPFFRCFDLRRVKGTMAGHQRVIQHFQPELGIADQRRVCRIIGAGNRGIDIEMNDFGTALCGMAPTFGGHRAGAAADEDYQIGLIDNGARLRRAAVGADHADGERVLFVDRAFAADGCRHRRAKPLGEFDQLRLAPARSRPRRRR